MNNKSRKAINTALVLIVISTFLAINIYKHFLLIREVHKTMDKLTLHYNNRDNFLPVISAVASKNEIEQIFAIPFKNCVGTYYADDGITALECSGEIADKKVVFPLYDSYPLAPGQIFNTLPVNKDEIIWGLNLIFDIVNIKKHSDLAFGLGLSDYTEDIKFIDKDNYIILFKLRAGESTYKYRLVKLHQLDYSVKSAWGNYDRIAELTSEDELQNDLDHCQHKDFLFFYSEKNHVLQVYDKNLQKTTHPLVDAVTGYPFSISSILVHPTLPFALFISRNENEEGFKKQHFSFVRWEHTDKKRKLIPYPFETI
jgi:hypothetical protein